MGPDPSDHRDVLACRLDFLEALAEAPKDKADLVAELDHSRSTVNRAITELESVAYVERVPGGYVATQAGQLAAREYRAHVTRQESILAAREVLDGVPHDWTLPPELLADARVETAAPASRLFELLAADVATADRVWFVLPAVLDSRHLRLCHSRVVDGDLNVVVQASDDALIDAAREVPHLWSGLAAADGFEARRSDPLPLALFVVEGGARDSLALVTADDAGVGAFLHTRHPTAVAWGRERAATLVESDEDVSEWAEGAVDDPKTNTTD